MSSTSSSRPAPRRAEAPVRWVHISELEDPTPWLSGGELMLTTGIPLDSAAKQRAFVRLLADRNLAGLGFGTGFSHDEAAESAASRRPRSATSRSSRCPTRPRSSRSPRRPSPASSTSSTRCCSAGSPCSAGSSGWSSRSAAWRKSPRRSPPRSAARWRSSTAAASASPAAASAASSPPTRSAAIRKEALGHAADGHPFVPSHPSVAGRALAHPVISPGGGPPQAWVVIVRDSGGLGDFERLILQQAVAVVALELMRRRVARETERRLAGDVLAGALGGRMEATELRRRLEPFGIGEEAAVLVFALDHPAAAEPERSNGRSPPTPARRSSRRTRPAAASCSAPSSTPPTATRSTSPPMPAGRSAPNAAPSAPPPAARPRRRSLRHSFHEARCALEATALRQRQRAGGRLLARPRRLHPAALDPGRRRAGALLRQRPRPDRAGRRGVRRRAAALAGGLHRAERPVGASRPRGLLPPPHAALPDAQGRGADRPRPLPRPRPDRVLAGTASEGAGRDEESESRRRSSRTSTGSRSPRPGSGKWPSTATRC